LPVTTFLNNVERRAVSLRQLSFSSLLVPISYCYSTY